jgi:hypothetical protein
VLAAGGVPRILQAPVVFMPTDCASAVTCSVRSTRPVSTAANRFPSDSFTRWPSSLGLGSQTAAAYISAANADAKVDKFLIFFKKETKNETKKERNFTFATT